MQRNSITAEIAKNDTAKNQINC